jgi:hypothetical protein
MICWVYLSQNVIKVLKLGKMKWAEHITKVGNTRIAYKILIEMKITEYLRNFGVDVSIILKWNRT